MCIVALCDAQCGSMDVCSLSKGKVSGKHESKAADERKEKSRDAARERRAKEFEYFQVHRLILNSCMSLKELEEVLPSGDMLVGDKQKGTVDKTSLIRLTVAYLKGREVVEKGFSPVKEEDNNAIPEMDILTCLDGFSFVLGAEGDIIYVSKNVSTYMGLKPVELLGQTMADYIHPCDLSDLASLTSPLGEGEVRRGEVTVRMKCTVTERGRLINLNQASYKPLRITGQTCGLAKQDSGLSGALFTGTASPISPLLAAPKQLGLFTSRHSLDMKFSLGAKLDAWFTDVLGYPVNSLLGESFFTLIHTADIQNVQAAFLKLKEQGLCSTAPYRLLAYNGGFIWVQTRASCAVARRGSAKERSISCQHFQITGVQERKTIMASIQMPSEAEMEQKATKREEDVVDFKTADTHLVILEAKPLTSLPTSVIVTTPPKPVTQSLFGKEFPLSSTESLFAKEISSKSAKPAKDEHKKTPTATTSNFFVPGPANVNQVKEASDQTITLGSLDPSKEDLEEERKFFDMLFNFDTTNLEQLAPHNGVDNFDLKMPVKTTEQTTTEDTFKSEEYKNLNDIESFCELIVSGPSPTGTAPGEEMFWESFELPGSTFAKTDDLLLRPEENLMWGVNSGMRKQATDSKEKVIWGGGGGTSNDGGGRSREEPACSQKRRMLFSEVGGELPAKVRVVQNLTTDYLLSISQELG